MYSKNPSKDARMQILPTCNFPNRIEISCLYSPAKSFTTL